MSTNFILDCSITMAWCFEDEFDEYAHSILSSFNQSKALVPSLWNLEVTNVLLMAEKRNKLTPADSIRFLELLNSLPIYTSDLNLSMSEIITTARLNKLTTYDATYLLLAMHEGLMLATKDIALINACNENGIKIFKTSE